MHKESIINSSNDQLLHAFFVDQSSKLWRETSRERHNSAPYRRLLEIAKGLQRVKYSLQQYPKPQTLDWTGALKGGTLAGFSTSFFSVAKYQKNREKDFF